MMSQRNLRSVVTVTACVASLFAVFIALSIQLKWLNSESVITADRFLCGHWSLVRGAALVGIEVSPEQALEYLPWRSRGHNLEELAIAFEKAGCVAEMAKMDLDAALEPGKPVVLHLKSPEHFIAAKRDNSSEVLVFDVLGQRKRMSVKALAARFDGYAIKLQCKPVHSNRGARFQPESLVQDCGDVPWSERRAIFQFPFRNTGTETLQISNVRKKCSCIKVEFPRNVEPGRTGVILAEFSVSPNEARSFFQHPLIVESNDALASSIVLTATGNLDTEVIVAPASLLVDDRKEQVYYLFVRYNGEESGFEVQSASANSDHVRVEVISRAEYERRKPQLFSTSPAKTNERVGIVAVELLALPEEIGLPSRSHSVVVNTTHGTLQIPILRRNRGK